MRTLHKLNSPDDADTRINPTTLSGLVQLFYGETGTFQDTGGVTAANVGDPVGRWTDQSGGGNHFTQGTAGTRPTIVSDRLGGKVLYFDGTKYMSITNTFSLNGSLNAPWMVFATVCPLDLSTVKGIWGQSSTASNNPTNRLDINAGNGYRIARSNDSGTFVSRVLTNVLPVVNKWQVVSGGLNSGGSGYLRINGAGASLFSSVSTSPVSTTNTSIGAMARATPTLFFNGYMKDLVLFNREVNLATEAPGIERWLLSRIGIPYTTP